MTWYAIRTVPGAQKPQREYAVEPTSLGKDGRPRGKGYRIVPSLNPNMSAVERALSEAGYVHYMPAERRLVRDRKHTDLWKARRFAMLVGYVFVKGPVDFRALESVPGVHSIVGICGRPMEIDLLDILTLRSMEAIAEEKFDRDARVARKTIRIKSKKDARLKKIMEKLERADDLVVSLDVVAA